jgi:hypothetical protein
MQYSSVTAIVLLGIVAFCGFALHQARTDPSTPMLAGMLSIVTTALAAGLAWRQTNPWVVLGLIGGAFLILVIATLVADRTRPIEEVPMMIAEADDYSMPTGTPMVQ